MREKAHETKLVNSVKALGGKCYKVVLFVGKGYMDRSIFLRGRHYVAEVKDIGGHVSPQQDKLAKEIAATGVNVYFLWGDAGVEYFLNMLKTNAVPPDNGTIYHFEWPN